MLQGLRADCWRFDSFTAEIDPTSGWITLTGTAAIEGVMDYAPGYAEYVPLSTLEDFDSIIGVPVTIEHPEDMLDMDTTRDAQRGTVLSAEMDGDALRVKFRVTDAEAAQALVLGKRELSPGYDAELEQVAGEFGGKKYQAIQKKRRYNHFAIVDRARGGRRARVDHQRTDGLLVQRSDMEDEEMLAVTINGTEYQVPAAVAAALGEKQAADAKEAAAENEDAAVPTPTPPAAPAIPATPAAPAAGRTPSSITVKMDAASVDALKKDITTDVTAALVAVMRQDRALERRDAAEFGEAVARTKPFLPASYRFDGKSTAALMADAIAAHKPELKGLVTKHRTDAAFLRGLFEGVCTPKGEAPETTDAPESRADAEDEVSAAQDKQTARYTRPLQAVQGGK